MTPWSVSPMAGWPYAAARSASASILHAPSSSEYSEWTCRCATEGLLIRAENDRWSRGRERGYVAPSAILTWLSDCPTIRHDGRLRRAGGQARDQRMRHLHRSRRLVPEPRGVGGGSRGEQDVGVRARGRGCVRGAEPG